MPDNKESNLDLGAFKKRLLAHKAQLEHDIQFTRREISEEGDDLVPERGGVGNHMADEASDTAEQETQFAVQTTVQHELDQVEEALARIEAGTYGKCANCGKPIDPERLEARPYSIYDINCQQLAEQGRL